MTNDERALRVVQSFRSGEDKSMKALLRLVSEALQEAVLEERHACLRAMYSGLDLGRVERVITARQPSPVKKASNGKLALAPR